MWIAEGTLPEAPDIRPSVTRATLNPCLAGHLVEVSAYAFWHPLIWSWKRSTTMTSFSNSPRLKAATTSSWSSNTIAGASTIDAFQIQQKLWHATPKLPCITCKRHRLRMVLNRAITSGSKDAWAGFPYQLRQSIWVLERIFMPCDRNCQNIFMQETVF